LLLFEIDTSFDESLAQNVLFLQDGKRLKMAC